MSPLPYLPRRLLKNSTYLRRRLLPDLFVAKYPTNHRFACDFAPRSRPRFERLAYGVVFQQTPRRLLKNVILPATAPLGRELLTVVLRQQTPRQLGLTTPAYPDKPALSVVEVSGSTFPTYPNTCPRRNACGVAPGKGGELLDGFRASISIEIHSPRRQSTSSAGCLP